MFGVNPKKIIIIGDSAGGNMAISIISLLIKEKRRIPDAVFLAYPGIFLTVKNYTPSLALTLTD